jgi:hypothetical protein
MTSATTRNESVSEAEAVTAHVLGVRAGKTAKEIAGTLGMKVDSFNVKISQARKKLKVSTTVFVDPSDPEKQINGVDLMARTNTTPKDIDNDESLTIVKEGQLIPLSVGGQRSTNGNQGLVDLMAALAGETDNDSDDAEGAEATAETGESPDSDGEDSDTDSE